jgi:hypothetical protein
MENLQTFDKLLGNDVPIDFEHFQARRNELIGQITSDSREVNKSQGNGAILLFAPPRPIL